MTHFEDESIVPPSPTDAEAGQLEHDMPRISQTTGELGMVGALADSSGSDDDIAVKLGAIDRLPQPDAVPSLLPLLEHPKSANEHRYDDTKTVYTKAREAKGLEEYQRTPSQKQLLKDMVTLKEFAPYASVYEDVYTPEELRSLVSKLELLRQKNRPDFDGLEGKILDVILDNPGSVFLNGSTLGIAKRARENAENRHGMQWSTLTKLAGIAAAIMNDSMLRGSERQRYLVGIEKDPDAAGGPDLTNVYQFVATSHAYDIYGERSVAVQPARAETFEQNCAIVNAWYAEVAPVLDSLPIEFIGERHSASWEIRNLVNRMNTRLTGEDRFGKTKNYKLDPLGAVKLQLKIGHVVEFIRENLAKGIHPSEIEIIPLDFEI